MLTCIFEHFPSVDINDVLPRLGRAVRNTRYHSYSDKVQTGSRYLSFAKILVRISVQASWLDEYPLHNFVHQPTKQQQLLIQIQLPSYSHLEPAKFPRYPQHYYISDEIMLLLHHT